MSLEDARRKVESEVRLLEEFMNELKWLDRGLKGEKMRMVAGGKVVKEDPEPVKARAKEALRRLRDPKFTQLLEKYGVALPSEADIDNAYQKT